MSDWLDKIQQQKDRERLDLERRVQRRKEDFSKSPTGLGLRKYQSEIRNVYERLAKELDRAVKIGGFYLRLKESGLDGDKAGHRFLAICGSSDKDHWYGELRCEGGPLHPLRMLSLYVKNDAFEVEFVWHSRPYPYGWRGFYHDSHKELRLITRIDDEYVSYLMKWLATGQPEFRTPSEQRGFLGRLFR